MEALTFEEALAFFSLYYRGEHHIPGYKPKPCGNGWEVKDNRGGFATFDFNQLTRLVIMAHDCCIRVDLYPHAKNITRIAIWKRQREGGMSQNHPTLEDAVKSFRESNPDYVNKILKP